MNTSKKCLKCDKNTVKNIDHDYCYNCFRELEEEDKNTPCEEQFETNIKTKKIFTVYIMIYDIDKTKIGYTSDLNSRIIELNLKYPNNKFVYFREFTSESTAKRFEFWLKNKSKRTKMNLIIQFQDKIKKIRLIENINLDLKFENIKKSVHSEIKKLKKYIPIKQLYKIRK
jgi:predicted GIY-YIG superfamily endonuclease